MNKFLCLILAGFVLSSCSREIIEDLIDERDGRVYQTVKIGDQIWMAENLAYMPFVSEVGSDSGIWVYGYNGKNPDWAHTLTQYKKLGCLYSWTVAMDLSTDYYYALCGCSDSIHQGICPDGWHLPSDREWQVLEDYLDTDPDFQSEEKRQNSGNAGKKLKSDTLWAPSLGGSNESKFNALPSGMRYYKGNFQKKLTYSYFWTASEYNPNTAVYRFLSDSSDGTFRGFPSKRYGFPVRCVKN